MMSMARLPSSSTIFSTYASFTGSVMLVQSMVNQLIPQRLQTLIYDKLRRLFFKSSFVGEAEHTLVIEESVGYSPNEFFNFCEIFLRTKINPSIEKLKITKLQKEKSFSIALFDGGEITDVFQGITLRWKFCRSVKEMAKDDDDDKDSSRDETRAYILKFKKEHKEEVLASYLSHVLMTAKSITKERKTLKLYTTSKYEGSYSNWTSVTLEHPATFDTLAMDHSAKKDIIEDLERFVRRKAFYRKVGKAWKRGYLLYGPPGTGKSSMVAAIANYLKFDIYDLELTNMNSNAELRKYLVSTSNKSILVIEDIDCSTQLAERKGKGTSKSAKSNSELTLSGVLNVIDGLWSTCGDERIIIFTTNHKDRLDPALLRPGRMDKHIHMSYCTTEGFEILASNYLDIGEDNKSKLYYETADLIGKSQITPAEVAEELMKSEDAEIALNELLNFIKKKTEQANVEKVHLEERTSKGEAKEVPDESQEPKKKNKGAEMKKKVKNRKKVEKVEEKTEKGEEEVTDESKKTNRKSETKKKVEKKKTVEKVKEQGTLEP